MASQRIAHKSRNSRALSPTNYDNNYFGTQKMSERVKTTDLKVRTGSQTMKANIFKDRYASTAEKTTRGRYSIRRKDSLIKK